LADVLSGLSLTPPQETKPNYSSPVPFVMTTHSSLLGVLKTAHSNGQLR
jgi:hypothetical protein